MRFDVLTLFPHMFDAVLKESIIKRAVERKKVKIHIRNLRDFTFDRHRTCDDKPFGGGPGMIMKPEPIFKAYQHIMKKTRTSNKKTRFIYLTPQGKRLDQRLVESLACESHLILLCGHYEEVDERVREHLVTDEISVGDYVLTGGELPAMVLIDAITRLLKGVLGKEESKVFESFSTHLLEYPQYTRPASFEGMRVPEILLSGDHKAIETWRQKKAYERTLSRRPDLLLKPTLTKS